VPLFRRHTPDAYEWFTVGVQAHRVVPGSRAPGIQQLEGLGDYVEGISRRRPPGPDGRDRIAVLNAKMDLADAVNDLVAAAVLACEELVERGLLEPSQAPASPPFAPLEKDLTTYDYIQQLHMRAVERREWLANVDGLLRLQGVALMAPAPVDG
jgi:hypothetical protein